MPDRVAQSISRLNEEPEVPGSTPVQSHTFVSLSADSRAVVSYLRKYVQEVLVTRLGGLSLPRRSVFRLTDRPDMIIAWTVKRHNNSPETFFYLNLCYAMHVIKYWRAHFFGALCQHRYNTVNAKYKYFTANKSKTIPKIAGLLGGKNLCLIINK